MRQRMPQVQLITFPSLELALVILSQEPSDDCEAALSMKDCTKIKVFNAKAKAIAGSLS